LRRRRAAPRFAAGGQADLRARSDMGIGLLFSFQTKNSTAFRNIQEDVRLFAVAVTAQGIKAGHPDSVDRLLVAGKVWFTNQLYNMIMFD
jgi:hypothetical protein